MSLENPDWLTSSFCTSGACVSVAFTDDGVIVGDSKDAKLKTRLAFTPDEWSAFIAGVKAGEFG